MQILFIWIILIVYVCSLELPFTTKCDCSEYSINECDSETYCSWDGYECVDLDCSLTSQLKCSPKNTQFKCQWDYINNECASSPQTCSKIPDEIYCQAKSYHGLDCMWISTLGCVNFSCSQSEKCYLDRCSFQSGSCGEPLSTSINCQSISQEYCQQSDGHGQYCELNDNNQCSSYDALVNCPQLSDNKAECIKMSIFCVYENNSCRKFACEDIILETDCTYILNPQNQMITVCFWTGSRCRAASDLDVNNFNQQQCWKNTRLHYKWEDSKCKQCTDMLFNIIMTIPLILSLLI